MHDTMRGVPFSHVVACVFMTMPKTLEAFTAARKLLSNDTHIRGAPSVTEV